MKLKVLMYPQEVAMVCSEDRHPVSDSDSGDRKIVAEPILLLPGVNSPHVPEAGH